MAVTSAAAFALLLLSTVAGAEQGPWYETVRLDGVKHHNLVEGPRFSIPDTQCSGYIDLAVPPFNNRICSGSAPATLRVLARSQHAAPTVTLLERMRVIKVTRSACAGIAYVQLHYACQRDHNTDDAAPYRWFTAGKKLWKRASDYFSSL